MTCIVGLVKGGKMYMGGDSAGVGGYHIQIRDDSKVFKKEKMLFGFSSSFRMGQILQHSLTIPKRYEDEDDYEYMTTRFIDAVRDILKEKGYATKKDDGEIGGVFIVAYKGQLYYIVSDYQVGMRNGSFESVGCGEPYALGALEAMGSQASMPGEKMVKKALQVAAKYSSAVSGPFNIISLEI